MGKRIFIVLAVLVFLSPALSQADGNSAGDDLSGTYDDTTWFDGGSGSTINTSPSAED